MLFSSFQRNGSLFLLGRGWVHEGHVGNVALILHIVAMKSQKQDAHFKIFFKKLKLRELYSRYN